MARPSAEPSLPIAQGLIQAVGKVSASPRHGSRRDRRTFPIACSTCCCSDVLLAVFMLGQVSASHRGLRRASIGLLPLLLTLALIVILDLDRTGEGSILVSQQPLADLDAIKSRRYHREAFRNRCGLPGRSGPATSPPFELHQWNIRKCRSPRLPDADRASLGQGKGGAAAPPLFGAVKLLVNSWPGPTATPGSAG